MIFQRINRTNAERIFVVMKANEANVDADDVVQLELTAASVDGINVVEMNANELNALVGVADAAIANGAYGLVQTYGYRSTSKVLKSGSSFALGQALVPVGGSDEFGWGGNLALVSGLLPSVIALETLASSAGATHTASIKIFIRLM